MNAMKKGYIPQNTEKTTRWAVNNFLLWKQNRNVISQEAAVPDDILDCTDPAVLSHWLSCFAAETRTTDGTQYPPNTIYSLLAGIQRHMKSKNADAPTFLNKEDNRFKDLHNTLDVIFRGLREKNIGTSTSHHQPFDKDEIDHLWATGVLGTGNPLSLLNAVFFYTGMQFCLRGGDEHQKLRLEQIKREETGYVYYENGSKNRKGTFSERGMSNKVAKSVAVPEAGERCHVYLPDLYISKLPPDAHKAGAFYLRPLPNTPWYTAVPIGKNTLCGMVKNVCVKAGLETRTNHSLRATAATALFKADVPEKVIQERTGHRSLDALLKYERSTERQHGAASKILAIRKEVDYQKALCSVASEKESTSSSTARTASLPITLNIHSTSRCIINLSYGPPPESTQEDPVALPELSEKEVEELFSDF